MKETKKRKTKKNIERHKKTEKTKKRALKEQKTKGMSISKKGYISNLLNDKSPSYIEENFKYVVEMFEREESETSKTLVEEAKKTAVSKDARVPASKVISESTTVENTPVNNYLTALKEIR